MAAQEAASEKKSLAKREFEEPEERQAVENREAEQRGAADKSVKGVTIRVYPTQP